MAQSTWRVLNMARWEGELGQPWMSQPKAGLSKGWAPLSLHKWTAVHVDSIPTSSKR